MSFQSTVLKLRDSKKSAKKLICLTCYDASFAALLDDHLDMILVGDSLGMVIQGANHTLSVTMEEMIYHTRCVSSRIQKSLLIADMPFLSYQASLEEGIKNAGRLIAAGAHGVKVEGGTLPLLLIEKLTQIGIPVVGHIGLTPQSVHAFGGYRVQGKDELSQQRLCEEALALEKSGTIALVLEAIPQALGKRITESISIPTIGIGAGPHCDGQILVLQDFLGLSVGKLPRFVRSFAQGASIVTKAVRQFRISVEDGTFPSPEESY